MGFFAGELEVVLREHNPIPSETPWNILSRLSVHPQQIVRLQEAAGDIGLVATLPPDYMLRLKQDLNITPSAWARLQAGIEADAFLRLMMYHSYSLEEAVNTANAIFAQSLKDRLAVGEQSDSIYLAGPAVDALFPQPAPMRRQRGRKRQESVDLSAPPDADNADEMGTDEMAGVEPMNAPQGDVPASR